MEDVTCERPMLRYHGGKWVLAPKIISYFPEHRIYVEPFGGAASVLLRKRRSYAEVYNDLNGEVVNLFKVVRDRGEELRQRVELTPFSREEYALSFEQSDDSIEQARRPYAKCMGMVLHSSTSYYNQFNGYPVYRVGGLPGQKMPF